MKFAVDHASQFAVSAPLDHVFDLLADVPRSVSHFPEVTQLIPTDIDTYRWEMQPVGALKIQHQVVYACRYIRDADQRGLSWVPVEGIGNGRIAGRWKLQDSGMGTQLNFATEGELDVPVPTPLRLVAKPVVERQFRQQVQRYLDNLRDVLTD